MQITDQLAAESSCSFSFKLLDMGLHPEHGSSVLLALLTTKSPFIALGTECVPSACVRRDTAWPCTPYWSASRLTQAEGTHSVPKAT